MLYDSQADPSAMENHLNREEIAEALETDGGVGAVLRDALPKDDYYALRLTDDSVIRIADTRSTVWNLLLVCSSRCC